MNTPRDHVHVQEPPIHALEKQRSCLRRTCISGFGCATILLISSLLILKFTLASPPKTTKKLPDFFPTDIQLYDPEAVYQIYVFGKQESGKTTNALVRIPTMILRPIANAFYKKGLLEVEDQSTGLASLEQDSSLRRILSLSRVSTPERSTNSVLIEWRELQADPKFVEEYVISMLKRAGYTTEPVLQSGTMRQFDFSKDTTKGTLYIEDRRAEPGTDRMYLEIILP